MKSDTIIHGVELLVILDKNENICFSDLEKISRIKGTELIELIKYLVEKEYIIKTNSLFVNSTIISPDKIKLDHKGMEVNLGKRDYFDDSNRFSQEIQNQTNLHNSPNPQIAQTTGDNSSISQTYGNMQIIIINQIIDDDPELDDEKKTGLKEVVRKIKVMKDSGETAEKIYGWIKKGMGICARYGPYLIALV